MMRGELENWVQWMKILKTLIMLILKTVDLMLQCNLLSPINHNLQINQWWVKRMVKIIH